MRKSKTIIVLLSILMAFSVYAPVYAAKKEKKVTMYLVTHIEDNEDFDKYDYSYTKNGLIKKRKFGCYTTKYHYKNGYISKAVTKSDYYSDIIVTYKYNKGNVIQTVFKQRNTKMVTKRTYDKKGRVVKEVLRLGDQIFINKMKYNKKNQVSKVTMSSNLYPEKYITKYKYDKKGNPIEIIKNEGKFIIKNEYSKGYLKKTSQHLEGEGGSYENTYKYKKVKVPKSKVKRVEEQQKILILTGQFDLVY